MLYKTALGSVSRILSPIAADTFWNLHITHKERHRRICLGSRPIETTYQAAKQPTIVALRHLHMNIGAARLIHTPLASFSIQALPHMFGSRSSSLETILMGTIGYVGK